MSAMDENPPSFVPSRRYRIALSVLVGVVSAVVIFGLVNHLAATRLRWRKDFSATGRFQLSPLTRQVLESLTNDVKVTVLFPRDSDLFGHIDGLLREYSEVQPRIHARYVDADAEPVTAIQVRTTYKLGLEDANLVVFDSGGQTVRVAESELSAYDANVNAMMEGRQKEIRRTAFKGELMFTSALAELATTNRPHACFLTGHDEVRMTSEEGLTGFYRFAQLLRAKSATVSEIRLDGTNDVPENCQLLVIPGPAQEFLPQEVERIRRYLDGGGRVLLALNSSLPTLRLRLEPLMFDWGIKAASAYAADTNQTSGGFTVYTTNLGSHPITLPMIRNESRVFFYQPLVVGTLPMDQRPADAPKATPLVATGPGGMTRSDLRNGTVAFLPGVDLRGTVPMAAAAERGGVTGVAAGSGTARLVVVGDHLMFGNDALTHVPGNVDFAELTLAWLLDRTQMLAIGPKPVREYRLYLTPAQHGTIRWTLLGVLPGSVLLVGFVVWMRRRN
jgi:hypothetical protein